MPGPNRLLDERLLGASHGSSSSSLTLIGPPMATIAANSRQSGSGVALVELDAMERGPALAEHVLVDARRLAGDVLEDEDVHARLGSTVTSTPCTEVLSPMSARSPGLSTFTFARAGSRFGQRPFGE